MPIIDELLLAVLTRDVENAGTDTPNFINGSINIDGIDVARIGAIFLPPNDLKRGNAGILPFLPGSEREYQQSFNSEDLTNSSFRVGIQGDDAWAPQHILLLGRTLPSEGEETSFLPLAIEMEIEDWLSSDYSEGVLTIPIRVVGIGDISTRIRRVLFLVRTANGDDDGTSDRTTLEVTIGGTEVLRQELPLTGQDDLEPKSHNWYILGAIEPFNKRDLMADGTIKLISGGKDAWLPREVYVYGFDTAEGRPNLIVPLVSMTSWDLGYLSKETGEGQPSITLPVT